MSICVVILADYSNGFNGRLVQFHPFLSDASISKMIPENFPVLKPLKKCLLMAGNSCLFFLNSLECSSLITTILLISPSYPLSPTIRSPCLIFNIEPYDPNFLFLSSSLPPWKIVMSCIPASKGPLSNTNLPS